ncbi:acyltransferase family protein [Kordiimonas aestuarii]|uniref:acyltransferase family protein n=1 Tax=Kordiimonas aestuarii TaxID=1005925 RepID=UPI0021CE69FF|nr:DUF5009 domain-containing protein [Kordiimonas aestuarii]
MGKQRLLSLDVFRGLAVIGMIFVNSVAVFHYGTTIPAYGIFLHAPWAGLTVADLVFPFFIFMVGVSLPFALGHVKSDDGGSTRSLVAKLFKRAALLFLIGLALTLSFADWSEPIRLLGVLQRIGLTFLGAAIFFIGYGWRAQIAVILVILVGYHFLQMIPIPDAPVDLLAPGQNYSSWFDRFILGSHVYARNAEIPFEPEGLLGTLPSIAQALMGALTGSLIRAKGCTGRTLCQMCAVGLFLTLLGFGLAPFHPIVKATWSSTFVLATSGLALLVFTALIWCLDVKGWRGPLTSFAQAFGINAITAYVVHTYLMGPLLLNGITESLQDSLAATLPAEFAMLVPVMIVVLASWLPVAIMKRKGIILKV